MAELIRPDTGYGWFRMHTNQFFWEEFVLLQPGARAQEKGGHPIQKEGCSLSTEVTYPGFAAVTSTLPRSQRFVLWLARAAESQYFLV